MVILGERPRWRQPLLRPIRRLHGAQQQLERNNEYLMRKVVAFPNGKLGRRQIELMLVVVHCKLRFDERVIVPLSKLARCQSNVRRTRFLLLCSIEDQVSVSLFVFYLCVIFCQKNHTGSSYFSANLASGQESYAFYSLCHRVNRK